MHLSMKMTGIVVLAQFASVFATTAYAEKKPTVATQAQIQMQYRRCISFMKTTPFSCDPWCDPLCRSAIPFSLMLPSECEAPREHNVCPQTK